MTGSSCPECTNLQIQITEKDSEIKRLTLQIQNLIKSLNLYEGRSCHKCYCSTEIMSEPYEKCTEDDDKTCFETNIELSSKIEVKNKEIGICRNSNNLQLSNEKDGNETVQGSEETNDFLTSNEYIYDDRYNMYFCVSTGYYYDKNTGLYYVPENGAYYTYDYSKNAYILYDEQKAACSLNNSDNHENKSEAGNILIDHLNKDIENSKADDSCESVVDQVNNLNINDVENSINSKHVTEDIVADREKMTCSESQENELYNNLSEVWETSADSTQTIQDLVREVAEQNSGISDYTYDEKYQMYYSASTGYYYDAVKKLLYDPQSGIYYKYDEENSSYEFYYRIDLNAIEAEKKAKQGTVKVKERRRYWRKKLTVKKQNSNSIEHTIKMENLDGDYSSPEEGELFSSESDQEIETQSEALPSVEKSSDDYSPCIRAIVKDSTKLKIGTLILITCSGGIIGRGKCNAVCIPDIGISKIHADILFNNELWKYVIKDLGSQNGTFVNDKRLSEPKELSSPCVLNHGDIVSIGSCKLLFHIHVGHETCDECEPGQVMAEKPVTEEKSTAVYMTKEEKEKERRQEVRRLKQKYGLEGMGAKNIASTSKYEDKAEIRRKIVGSDNPYEKTEASSLDKAVNESNKGYQMLKKLGWKEGDSLGVTGLGISEPIPLRPWLSKAGLGSSEEQQASMFTITEDKRNKKWVLAQERFLKLT